jgi:hypothetical protein
MEVQTVLLLVLFMQKPNLVIALVTRLNIGVQPIANKRGNVGQRKVSSTILCDSSFNPYADIAKTEKTYSPFTNGIFTTVTMYSLFSEKTESVFIGYTSIKLVTAIKNHKSIYDNPNSKSHDNPLYKLIRANGGWSNWDYYTLEIYPSIDRKEALTKQKEWIQQTPNAINKRRPITSCEEDESYYEDNRTVLLEQKKVHRESNSDSIKERMKVYRGDHKNDIAENKKAYYEANKVAICAQKKVQREAKKLLKLMALEEKK